MGTWLTPSYPLAVTLETDIKADSALDALLQGEQVYKTVAGRANEVRARPYVVLAFPTEEPSNLFSQKGHITSFQIHICTGNINNQVLVIYNHLKRLFSSPFAIADHDMVQVTLRLIGEWPEERYEGNRGIVECTVRSLAA
jgi:hypothetical protein